MKRLLIAFSGALLAGALLITSCDSTTTEKIEEQADTLAGKLGDAVDNMGNRADSLGKNDAEDDAEFVREVVRANNTELHMLAEGKTKGTDAELKSAAKKMETDHKKMASEMKAYAAKKNIALDTADMDHDNMNEAKGADWDERWAKKMVDEHERDVRKFEDAEDDVMDEELKSIITKTLPTLREHLETSKKLQEKLDK